MQSMDNAIVRYGGQGLLPIKQQFHAGPISADLMEDGSLRYIMFGGKEIARSIYSAFRDENWGTVPVSLDSFDIRQDHSSFTVIFHAVHKTEQIHFEWDGTISGDSEGTIRYSMKGTAHNDFLKNRLGFCILNPLEVAGTPVQVETDEGIVSDEFAKLITPHDPFTHMKSMTYPLDDQTSVSILFEGDLFHTEDQRNWTDASYKTFCTPLDIPYPVKVNKGDSVSQVITIQVTAKQSQASVFLENKPEITVGATSIGKLPALGTWFAPLNRQAGDNEIERLRALHLSQLRVQLNLLQPGWASVLRNAVDAALKLKISLQVEALTDNQELGLRALITLIHEENMPVVQLSPFPEGYNEDEKVKTKCELSGSPYRACQFTTKRTMAEQARKWLDHFGLKISVGGGSRTNFTEFNRSVLPLELLDVAEYAMQPQTHAFDVASITETLEVQELTVKTAKSIIAEYALPLHINSVTFKWRINPYATSDDGVKVERQDQIDPRLHSLFGAGWTIGSIHRITSENVVRSINYYEHAGVLGLMDDGGQLLFPVYHVLAQIAEFSDADILPVQINTSKKIEGFAVKKDFRIRIFLANLENDSKTIELHLPSSFRSQWNLKILDENNYSTMMQYPKQWSQEETKLESCEDILELSLSPFAVAVLDGKTES